MQKPAGPEGAADLAGELRRLEAEHLYRRRRIVDHGQDLMPCEVIVDGRRCVNFCSNDYLGLAREPRVAEAMARGAVTWGAGSGAAHLVTGHTREHHALEEELAAFVGRPRAVLFSTGYMANIGTLSALAGRGDFIAEDRLNHASLIDAARLSGARVRRYAHGDADAAEKRLGEAPAARRLVVTDGVFSMDGDTAPLGALAGACRRNGAWLVVDDAHGLGVIGPGGQGSIAAAGIEPDAVTALVGTLGKAFGTFGAFVASGEDVAETVIQRARTYIYTTAPPPAVAAATRAALAIVRTQTWRRERLAALVARFRAGARELGLALMESSSPIQPVLVGDAAATLEAGASLFEAGLWVAPIRPPTVPEGSARLRVTFSANHEDAHLDRLLDTLGTVPGLRRQT